MRAGRIFIMDLKELDLLEKVHTVKINLYGSLAATGKGHHTPQAILLGLEGSDPETIDTGTIPSRYTSILETKSLTLGGTRRIHYDQDRDMLWRYDMVLKTHPNGMRFSAFDENGDLLATNEYFSVGGGFVVNEKTKVDENLFYKGVDKKSVHGARLHQSHAAETPLLTEANEASTSTQDPGHPGTQPTTTSTNNSTSASKDDIKDKNPSTNDLLPPYPFDTGATLLALTQKHNLSIAQIVHDNEKFFGYTEEEIHEKVRPYFAFTRSRKEFYPGIASAAFDVPAIGPGSGIIADAISGPRSSKTTTTTDFEDEDKGVYELVQEQDPSSSSKDNNNPETKEAQAARKQALLAKLKRVPKIVGSVNHAIMPMPPVSVCLVLS
ncbi:hypothetical protein NP233_g3949 [Leucocoprinus birnbaumii]|uniref:Serine dehydratase beta chain domain-containing protein n=1 Tax=Leucocoprinus birnbaumii TaxID=56174 RepID=A0AAD5VWD0_9AGAR|nr:hypothetical protein NP233_g3949 [Leucocoprinus birnbaumii]